MLLQVTFQVWYLLPTEISGYKTQSQYSAFILQFLFFVFNVLAESPFIYGFLNLFSWVRVFRSIGQVEGGTRDYVQTPKSFYFWENSCYFSTLFLSIDVSLTQGHRTSNLRPYFYLTLTLETMYCRQHIACTNWASTALWILGPFFRTCQGKTCDKDGVFPLGKGPALLFHQQSLQDVVRAQRQGGLLWCSFPYF